MVCCPILPQVTHNAKARELEHGLVFQHPLLLEGGPGATAPHPIRPWATQKPLLSGGELDWGLLS